MKILPKHQYLRSLYYGFMIAGSILIFCFSYVIAYSFRSQIIWFVLAVLFMLTPWANRKISVAGVKIKSFSWITRVGLTFLLQLGLMLAFYTICDVTEFGFPNNYVPYYLFQTSALILLAHWGVFPWGAYALLAVSLSYVVYIKQQSGNMSALIQPALKNIPMDTVSLAADVWTKMGILFTLATTLALIAMQFVSLLGVLFHYPIAYGLRLDILLLLFVVFKVIQDGILNPPLNWCLKRRWPPFLIILSFLMLMAFAVWLLGMFIGFFSPKYTPVLTTHALTLPGNWSIVWAIFMAMWWLGWAPLSAGMLAYIWQGYRLRTMVFFILLLPVMITIFTMLHPEWVMAIDLKNRLWNFLPAIVALGIIVGLFFRTQPISYLFKAILPAPTQTYQRSPKAFLKNIAQLMVFMMGMYWINSAYAMGVIYFSMLFPMELSLLLAGVAVFRSFLKRNVTI